MQGFPKTPCMNEASSSSKNATNKRNSQFENELEYSSHVPCKPFSWHMSISTNLASNLITQAPSKILANAKNLISSFKLITSVVEPRRANGWREIMWSLWVSCTLGRSLDSNFESSTRDNKEPHQKKITGNRHAQNHSNSNYKIILHIG